jgi:predicted peptidase
MIKKIGSLLLAVALALTAAAASRSEPQLLRVSYHSAKMNAERDYFVYLPRGFKQQAKWPVMLFLHGNGERGDGKGELEYVLKHGPVFEAWAQKKDLPFVIISPQMPMYDQGEVDYIKHRTRAEIPLRLAEGINPYPAHYTGKDPMNGQLTEALPTGDSSLTEFDHDPRGWNTIADEVMAMVDHVLATYKGDPRRVYLTGLSYGGTGTWYLAAKHPEKFAAIAPVVGFGSPDMAPVLAQAKLPMWVFAGGRDPVVPVKYFYPLLNKLEELGHPDVRFTIESDMGHDTWIRVYAGQDLYTWLLSHSR